MFAALLILFFLPNLNNSRVRNAAFRPYYAFFLFWFFVDVFILG